MVKVISLSFVAAIFLAAVAFSLPDGWFQFVSYWAALICGVTFVAGFFLGLMPSRQLERREPLIAAKRGFEAPREELLRARTQHVTQWNIKYENLPKT